MIVLFLAVIFINSVFLMFSYSYKVTGINRVLLNTPTHIFEASIPLAVQYEKPVLYYDQNELKNRYENYLEKEITKYTDKYEVEYYFYNINDGGYCDVKECRGVEISVTAEVMFNNTINRVMSYEIVESKYYG